MYEKPWLQNASNRTKNTPSNHKGSLHKDGVYDSGVYESTLHLYVRPITNHSVNNGTSENTNQSEVLLPLNCETNHKNCSKVNAEPL